MRVGVVVRQSGYKDDNRDHEVTEGGKDLDRILLGRFL